MSKRSITAKITGTAQLVAGVLAFGTLTPALGGTLTLSGAGQVTIVGSSGSASTPAPAAPAAASTSVPSAAAPVYVGSFLSPRPVMTITQPSAASPESHGPDEKWGDPINADLFETDSVHAKLDYYAGSGNGGTQAGVGITLSFPN